LTVVNKVCLLLLFLINKKGFERPFLPESEHLFCLKSAFFTDIQGKANFLNFTAVHLIAVIILKHSFLCHFMGLVDISGHV